MGFVLALAVVAVTGASAGGLALLAAAVACPIAMVVALKILVGGADRP